MIKKVSAIQARQKLGSLMNAVSLRDDEFIIERAGKPMAVLISIKRFNKLIRDSLQNNIEIDMSEDIPITEISAELGGFDFLEDEPDIYSIKDLKKRYV